MDIEQLKKEVKDKLTALPLNKSKLCRDNNISVPTLKKVISGQKVSEGTIYKLNAILS